MAEEEMETVELHDAFYRDSIGKVIFIGLSLGIAIVLMLLLSIYLYAKKPKPVVFPVYQDWLVQPSIPVSESYPSQPMIMQWLSDTMRKVFTYDFRNYISQRQAAAHYFTDNGWNTFLNQLNIYVNYNNVLADKLFVNGTATAAPTLVNEGLISGRYTWTIQMPMVIEYAGYKPLPKKPLQLEIRVVRVPTTSNLLGIAIDSVTLATTAGIGQTGAGSE